MRAKLKLILFFEILMFLSTAWQSWMHLQGALIGCVSTGAMSCDVMFSQYGYWFGIPTPFLALGFFLLGICLTVFALIEKNDEVQKKWVSLLSIHSWLALLTTLYFAFISFVVLKKFCPYCAVFYVGSIGVFVFIHQLKAFCSPIKDSLLSLVKTPKWLASALASVSLTVGLALSTHQDSKLVGEKFEIAGDSLRSLGAATAKFHIVEYSDFECPHCKKMGAILKQLEREEAGSIQVTYKFYPLDPKCNEKMPPPGHANSCGAARSAYCASKQNKFWVYHDVLFANQEQLSPSLWDSFAEQTGLDLGQFKACLNSNESLTAVKSDISEADKLNIEATPTLFINGQKYEGDRTLEAIKSFLKSM